MKRILTALILFCLTVTLSACGHGGEMNGGSGKASAAAAGNLSVSPYTNDNFGQEIALSTEWPDYGPSVKQISVLAENLTGKSLAFNVFYEMEVQLDGIWYHLPVKVGADEADMGREIPAHDTIGEVCPLTVYDYTFVPGTYRMIARYEGGAYAAEFTMSEDSAITAEAPYGYTALETLSKDYDQTQAAADGCVVYPNGRAAVNAGAWDSFFTKVRKGIPCQVRILRFTTEGDMVVQDVIYERVNGTGRFTYRYDATRDKLGAAAGIVENTYSYFITDAWSIYLSNDAKWRAGLGAEDVVELLTGDEAEPYIESVQTIADDQLSASVTRYRVWSGDQSAGLTETAGAFFYETDNGEYVATLAEIGVPAEFTTLTDLRLVEAKPNAVLILVGNEAGDGLRWYALYDPVEEKLLDCAAASGISLDQESGTVRLDIPDFARG